MKITIVNTFANAGGAARAAHRLHSGLRSIGHESTMYVNEGWGDGIVKYKARQRSVGGAWQALHTPRLRPVLARIWKRGLRELKLIPLTFDDYAESRPPGLDKYSEASSKFGADILWGIPSCDVINLH